MAQSMDAARLDDTGLADGLLHGALQRVLRRMVPALATGSWIDRAPRRRKHVLPTPFAIGARILDGQRVRQEDAPVALAKIELVKLPDLGKMCSQRIDERARQHGHSVLLALRVANH